VTPVAAATLVLLRDRPAGGPEVLLMRRHAKSKFAAGDFAFPGGKLEPAEPAEVGVIRETFEEVGVLLATDGAGTPARVAEPRFAEWRRACQRDNAAFGAMVRAEGLRLLTDRLVYFAHWITPDDQPLRYDTRFFAAEAPADQDAVGDDYEASEVRWLAPAEALEAQRRGELSMRFPTLTNLRLFEDAPSAAEAVRRLVGREIRTIQPRVVVENGVRRAILPGDPGY
jgi:8-oxo-dGTP pyrophosphatase MutT (NUDIX family)